MASAEPIEGRCGAKVSMSERNPEGGYCERHPMAGQTRCGTHGGRAPQAIAAAGRRQQEAELEQAVLTLGARRDISPEDGLLEQLQWTAGHVAWLLERVQELDASALIWGRTSEVAKEATEFPGVDTTREAAPNMWLVLYERFLKHYLAIIDLALKHKIDERRVRLAEQQGALVASRGQAYIAGVIDALSLDATTAQPIMQRLFAEMLRSLAGGPLAVSS